MICLGSARCSLSRHHLFGDRLEQAANRGIRPRFYQRHTAVAALAQCEVDRQGGQRRNVELPAERLTAAGAEDRDLLVSIY